MIYEKSKSKLYSDFFGENECTGWKPSADCFHELLSEDNNISHYSSQMCFLPKEYSGWLYCKCIVKGNPRIILEEFDNGNPQHLFKGEIEAILEFYPTKEIVDMFQESLESVRNFLTKDKIDEIIDRAFSSTKTIELKSLYYKDIKLVDRQPKHSQDMFVIDERFILKNEINNFHWEI